MPVLVIPDDILKAAGINESEAMLEFACRLFDAGKLTLSSAARLAKVTRGDLEDALLDRGIAIYRPQPSDLAEDLATLTRLGV